MTAPSDGGNQGTRSNGINLVFLAQIHNDDDFTWYIKNS